MTLLLAWPWRSGADSVDANFTHNIDANHAAMIGGNANLANANGRAEIDTEGVAVESAETHVLRGVCVEYLGNAPVADARITLETVKGNQLLASTKSDRNGAFELKVPGLFRASCTILVKAEGHLTMSRVILAGKRDLPEDMGSIPMHRPVRIGISVAGPDNSPTRAHVTLRARWDEHNDYRQLRSSAGDRFFIRDLNVSATVDVHGELSAPLIVYPGRWAIHISGNLEFQSPPGGLFDAEVSRHVYVRLLVLPQETVQIVRAFADGNVLLTIPPKWRAAAGTLKSRDKLLGAVEAKRPKRADAHPAIREVQDATDACIRQAIAALCYWTFEKAKLKGTITASGFKTPNGESMTVKNYEFLDADGTIKTVSVYFPAKLVKLRAERSNR